MCTGTRQIALPARCYYVNIPVYRKKGIHFPFNGRVSGMERKGRRDLQHSLCKNATDVSSKVGKYFNVIDNIVTIYSYV